MKPARWVVVLALLGASSLAEEYEIGPGDQLRIEVVGRPEMTDTFEVGAEGMINYWEVGRVKASGYTVQSLAGKLTTLLVQGRFMRRPQVRVSIADYGSQKVYVAGEVQRQGYYALKADRSLRGFMSEVPFNASAGHEVVVIRPGSGEATAAVPTKAEEEPSQDQAQEPSGDSASEVGGQAPSEEPATEDATPPEAIQIPGLPPIDPSREVIRVNLLELQVGEVGRDIPLQSGDTIFVPRAAQVYVTGAVARPGSFRYEAGMTVLQALTLAGGVTARGSEGGTRVVRIEDGKKVKRKVKPTDVLQPEDRLEVPERFF